MPRNPSSSRSKTAQAVRAAEREQQEERLREAADGVNAGQYSSIRAAAKAHDVPEATLRHRIGGRKSKKEGHATAQSLAPGSETALVEHIRRCAAGGFPLTPESIREYATIVSRAIPGQAEPVTVGKGWLQGFLLRHPSIRSSWSRCLDNERLRSTDEAGVREWFERLGEIIREYGISSSNIFNMDETNFRFGQGGSEKVIVPTGDPAAWFKGQPGSRESATVIECIGSGGQVLPPLVITKGKVHTAGEQRRMENIPATWQFSKTPNGWTSNELAVLWLEKIFDANTTQPSTSSWRLLILDGHGSHTTPEFLDAMWERRIVPFCLPPHSTHVMQPLDVSIFGPLLAAYYRLVNSIAPHVDGGIDKALFGTLLAQAREQVLTANAAKKAFADSGISVAPHPGKVLAQLASFNNASRRSGSTERMPPTRSVAQRTMADLDARLSAFKAESDPRRACTLKRALIQTYEAAQTEISVLRAKVGVLEAQEERNKAKARKGRRKRKAGDLQILTRDNMISREYAERKLIAKKFANAHRRKHKRRKEKEREVLPPSQPAIATANEEEDGNKGILASTFGPSPPPVRHFLDMLDDGEPLSAIEDNDSQQPVFYKEVPLASSSRNRL